MWDSSDTPLSPEEQQRYQRHLMLPEVGRAGQRALSAATVAVIGAGGLGSPVISMLAAAGVGTLRLIDHDRVDVSNLQRQVIHNTPSVGRLKVESAAQRVHELNPHVRVETLPTVINAETVQASLQGSDVVVDAVDNFATRYLINDTCLELGVPLVWAAVSQWQGQASVWGLPGGPCLRCVFPDEPDARTTPPASAFGLFGVVPGVMGMIQATETLKILLRVGTPLSGRLLVHDAAQSTWNTLPVHPCSWCPASHTPPQESSA